MNSRKSQTTLRLIAQGGNKTSRKHSVVYAGRFVDGRYPETYSIERIYSHDFHGPSQGLLRLTKGKNSRRFFANDWQNNADESWSIGRSEVSKTWEKLTSVTPTG